MTDAERERLRQITVSGVQHSATAADGTVTVGYRKLDELERIAATDASATASSTSIRRVRRVAISIDSGLE